MLGPAAWFWRKLLASLDVPRPPPAPAGLSVVVGGGGGGRGNCDPVLNRAAWKHTLRSWGDGISIIFFSRCLTQSPQSRGRGVTNAALVPLCPFLARLHPEAASTQSMWLHPQVCICLGSLRSFLSERDTTGRGPPGSHQRSVELGSVSLQRVSHLPV